MDIRVIPPLQETHRPELVSLLRTHDSLGKALADWAALCPGPKVPGCVPRVVAQDEYCHDVVVRWDDRDFVVYATT